MNIKIPKLRFVIGAALVLVVLVVLFVTNRVSDTDGTYVAVVRDSNKNEYIFPLTENTRYEISTSLGTNLIVVENGEIYISEASCPNHDCMNFGRISRAGQQIVCLPNELLIVIEKQTSPEESHDVIVS